jgi:hypothetical protein
MHLGKASFMGACSAYKYCLSFLSAVSDELHRYGK